MIPNYYSVLPAVVRYSKVLTDFEKILYSEVVSLSNAFGYCFASNSYFSRLYGKSIRTITSAIKKLEENDFITVEIKKDEGNKRYIYLTAAYPPLQKKINSTMEENFHSTMEENFHNNTTSSYQVNNNNAQARDTSLLDLFAAVFSKKGL